MVENPNEIDDFDQALIAHLMRRGRATWADLAEALSVSAPAVAARARRLEERGVIRAYAALASPEVFAPVCAFVAVSLAPQAGRAAFEAAVEDMAEVLECHRVAGREAYLLKVRRRSLAGLDVFLSERLGRVEGVASVQPTLALSTVKETTVLPISSAA